MKKIEQLRQVVILFSEILAEREEIKKVEVDTARGISEGARLGSHLSDSDIDKLGKAQVRKQMIPHRKKVLEEKVETYGAKTKSAWEAACRQFDNYVFIEKEKVFQKVLNAVEPYFGGPEKAKLTRVEFENLHVPARDELNRCFSPDFFDPYAKPETYLDFSKHFLEHVARVCAERGWAEADIESATRFVHPDSAALAHHLDTAQDPIVVRAKEPVSVDGKAVRGGQLMRITNHQYRALSRFFTRIEGEITPAMEAEIVQGEKPEPKKSKKSTW